MRKTTDSRVSKRWLKIVGLALVIGVLAVPVAVSAAHQFKDVPDTNIFHADIGWLSDNDITKGCNPPTNDLFCPSDNVTREQMAAFMKRLATTKVVDAATAVDSEKLGGLDPYNYNNILVTSSGSFLDGTDRDVADGETITATSAEITVPGAGVLLIHNTSSWDLPIAADYVMHSWTELDTTPGCDPSYFLGDPLTGSFATDDAAGPTGRANTAGTAAVEVPSAGTYTVHHCLQSFTGAGTNIDHALSVQWYPTGSATVANPPSPAAEPSGAAVEGSTTGRK